MAGNITGLGTTYNLPNYTGILYQLTPADTPFFSAIGGLSGGGQTLSTEFEWETFDLRAAAQPAVLEGAVAPTAQERVRGNVTNVPQIHQEKVSISYSKLAAIGLKSGSNNALPNPVTNEETWQVTQMLKQMVRDVEYSFINGVYQKPTDNTTARKTRGLISAITTNVLNNGVAAQAATLTASTDVFAATAHGLSVGDPVMFDTIVTSTVPTTDTVYYVIASGFGANAFKVSTTLGGSTINIDADGTANFRKNQALGISGASGLEALAKSVYDNGGLMEGGTATLIMNSSQKIALSAAYAAAYGKYVESSRSVGGVNFTTINTNFGVFNVMLDRFVPQHKVIVCSLEQCMPVYLETPGKGHFFAEPLAKVGASDDVQLYGEVGLAYGNEKAHGVLTGLAY